MKKLTIGLMVLSLLATFSIVGFGENSTTHSITVGFTEFVRVALNSGSNITFTVNTSSAGLLPPDDTNSDKRLYYLAFIGSGKTTTIDGQVTSGTIPSSYSISVEATIGNVLVGNAGTSAGEKTLSSTSAKDIITAIGPVATGVGDSKGAGLTYTLSFSEVPDSTANDEYTVTYTINDAS